MTLRAVMWFQSRQRRLLHPLRVDGVEQVPRRVGLRVRTSRPLFGTTNAEPSPILSELLPGESANSLTSSGRTPANQPAREWAGRGAEPSQLTSTSRPGGNQTCLARRTLRRSARPQAGSVRPARSHARAPIRSPVIVPRATSAPSKPPLMTSRRRENPGRPCTDVGSALPRDRTCALSRYALFALGVSGRLVWIMAIKHPSRALRYSPSSDPTSIIAAGNASDVSCLSA